MMFSFLACFLSGAFWDLAIRRSPMLGQRRKDPVKKKKTNPKPYFRPGTWHLWRPSKRKDFFKAVASKPIA